MAETFHNGVWSRKANGQCPHEGTKSHSAEKPRSDIPCKHADTVDVAVSAIMSILGFARNYPIERNVKLSERLDAALGHTGDEISQELTAIARQIHAKALVLNVMQSMLDAEFFRFSSEPISPKNALRSLASEFDREWHAKRSELLSIQDRLHEAIPKEIRPYVQDALHRKDDLDALNGGQKH